MIHLNTNRRYACVKCGKMFSLHDCHYNVIERGHVMVRNVKCDPCFKENKFDYYYHVVYDPDEGWGERTRFSGKEKNELLEKGYFTPGTILRYRLKQFVVSGKLYQRQTLEALDGKCEKVS